MKGQPRHGPKSVPGWPIEQPREGPDYFFLCFLPLAVADVAAVAAVSPVVADVAVLAAASAAGVAAVASVLAEVLVSGADTGGVETEGTVVLGVDTGGTVAGGVDTDGTVCAAATPEVPTTSAPARITNFMQILLVR